MINEPFWGLFWTTGMPEAWLLSRERMRQLRDAAGPGAEGMTAEAQPNLSDNTPGGPRGLT